MTIVLLFAIRTLHIDLYELLLRIGVNGHPTHFFQKIRKNQTVTGAKNKKLQESA
jgi:hypothetical protein